MKFEWLNKTPVADDDRDVRVEGSSDCHEYTVHHRRKGTDPEYQWASAPTYATARLYQHECYNYMRGGCVVWVTSGFGTFVVGETLA